jgi:hypothetical protein
MSLAHDLFNIMPNYSNAVWPQEMMQKMMYVDSRMYENETTEELNKIFIQILQNLNQKIKPLEKAVCLYHFNVFYGELGFHSRKKDPQNISIAQ